MIGIKVVDVFGRDGANECAEPIARKIERRVKRVDLIVPSVNNDRRFSRSLGVERSVLLSMQWLQG
jgi:hypothetical protein